MSYYVTTVWSELILEQVSVSGHSLNTKYG